ncbi:MAG: histidine kinase [Trebonia sp.]|jgi:signal transduction histidine kinase
MNARVVPATSPLRPGRRDGGRGRLGAVLRAPAGALALAGLAVTGVVLLVAVVGPPVLAVLGFGHLIKDLQWQGAWRGDDGRDLLGGVIGLACCRYVVPAALAGTRWLELRTRLLTAHWCGVAIPAAYRTRPDRLGFRPRMEWLLTDPGTWRDLLWLAVNLIAAPVLLLGPIALAVVGATWSVSIGLNGFDRSLGGLGLALGLASVPWTLRAYGRLARLVLAPTGNAELERRVAYLAQTRQESLESGAAELRRIERDLHDGAQARLVAMGLTLDAAGRLIDTDPAAARSLLMEARDASAKALAELRDLVRGVHPPVLADRGLADAVRALALDSPVRTRVTGSLGGRPPAPVESAAYFAVSELLANVAKHAGAQSAEIDLRHSSGALRITVRDDGDGGADPGRGSGLHGVGRRIAAFDGVLVISSPAGGPTVITMEIPCELS